jgi:hypothetical protein
MVFCPHIHIYYRYYTCCYIGVRGSAVHQSPAVGNERSQGCGGVHLRREYAHCCAVFLHSCKNENYFFTTVVSLFVFILIYESIPLEENSLFFVILCYAIIGSFGPPGCGGGAFLWRALCLREERS